MTTHAWPDHLLSLDEWAIQPTQDRHCELAEGVLIVSPRPAPAHQWLIVRLAAVLNAQLPDHLAACSETEVVIVPGDAATVRVPDIVVTTFEAMRHASSRLAAADVLLAVEVVSPGSRGTDRVMKVAEYAAAGIPHYWVVDPDAGEILALRLDGDSYSTVSTSRTVSAASPAPLRVDLAEVLRRR